VLESVTLAFLIPQMKNIPT